MWSSVNYTEDSDDTKMTERQDNSESEVCYAPQGYREDRRKQAESYHDFEHKCEKCGVQAESPKLGRRRSRRMKEQLQHCPSCHCHETVKYSIGRANCPKSMDDVLIEYEDLLTDPVNQTFRKSQPMSPRRCRDCWNNYAPDYVHRHLRKRQPSSHRRPGRSEHEQMISFGKNSLDSGSYEYPRSTRNSYRKEACCREEQTPMGMAGTADMDRDTAEKYMQYRRERSLKSEARNSRQHTEKAGKVNDNEKDEPGDRENEEWMHGKSRLKFDSKNTNLEDESDRKRQPRIALQSNKLSILKGYGSHASSKYQNPEDLSKQSDYPRGDDFPKEEENRSICKSYPRLAARQDPSCGIEKDPQTIIREERREETYRDLAIKEGDQESQHRKSVYAGGDTDLNLSGIKRHILGIIDQVLSKEYSASTDPQKSAESSRELSEQGICIEITRALQGDWCEPFSELFSRCESRADYIKHLETCRSEYMNRIHVEFKKLCDLQKFLDNNSPRQSFQSNSAVEQRVEQQPHDEKQNLGTIS